MNLKHPFWEWVALFGEIGMGLLAIVWFVGKEYGHSSACFGWAIYLRLLRKETEDKTDG